MNIIETIATMPLVYGEEIHITAGNRRGDGLFIERSGENALVQVQGETRHLLGLPRARSWVHISRVERNLDVYAAELA
jgi:hypothetical protein